VSSTMGEGDIGQPTGEQRSSVRAYIACAMPSGLKAANAIQNMGLTGSTDHNFAKPSRSNCSRIAVSNPAEIRKESQRCQLRSGMWSAGNWARVAGAAMPSLAMTGAPDAGTGAVRCNLL